MIAPTYEGLVVPVAVKADLARSGIAPGQLAPYHDPERGYVDPKADREVVAALWALVGTLWRASEVPT